MAKDYSDRPTVIIGFDSAAGELMGVTTDGFAAARLPALRIIVRDWAAGNEPDDNGDVYEDEEL